MRKLAGLEEAAGTDLAAELPLPPPLQLEAPLAEGQQQQRQQDGVEQQQQQQDGVEKQQQQQRQQQRQQGQQQQQVAAAASMPQLRRLLVLEGVQDPGNLGTLLRCATAFGWDGVWLLPGCCDPFNDKALRASRGASLRLPLVSGDWKQLEHVAAGNGLVLLAAEPEELEQEPRQQMGQRQEQGQPTKAAGGDWLQELRQQRIALVMGTEGQGLSQRALSACRPVSVPMMGDMESLNVGIAGGILMFLLSEGLQPMLRSLERLGSAAVNRRDYAWGGAHADRPLRAGSAWNFCKRDLDRSPVVKTCGSCSWQTCSCTGLTVSMPTLFVICRKPSTHPFLLTPTACPAAPLPNHSRFSDRLVNQSNGLQLQLQPGGAAGCMSASATGLPAAAA